MTGQKKVGRGGNKKTYTGKKSRSFKQALKRKFNPNFEEGDQVIFRSLGNVYLGWVDCTNHAVPYDTNIKKKSSRNHLLSRDNKPVAIDQLKLDLGQDLKNTKVLLLTDRFDGSDPSEEFPEFQVGTVLYVDLEQEELWVKPRGKHAVLTTADRVCQIPNSYKDLANFEDLGYDVSPSAFNAVSLVYKSTVDKLNETIALYNSTQEKLLRSDLSNSDLVERLNTLNDKYAQALKTIQELEQMHLLKIGQTSDQIKTLTAAVTKHKDDLALQEKQIVAMNKEILNLRQQIQEKDMAILRLQAQLVENQQVQKSQEELLSMYVKKIQSLQSEVSITRIKQATYLERRPGPADLLMTRKVGSNGKPHAAVPITLPAFDNPSSKALASTLDQRAKDIMKVLQAISSREKPEHADLVSSLTAFLRKYPSLAREAIAESNLKLYKELTPGESLDLKILLRIPMKRFRELRTILANHGINILASDGKMYEELQMRRNFSDSTLEFGLLKMKKTAKCPEPSEVPFVRTKSLKNHIADLLRRHLQKGDMWKHDQFKQQIWIKIGGDKGGSTTKLSVQIVNVLSPNSPDNTDLIAMFEATDTYDNQHLAFSQYTRELEDMQDPDFRLDLGPEWGTFSVRIFIYGDYEYLTKHFGHLGPNSRYPCLWCYVKLEHLHKPNGKEHSPMKLCDGKWVEREEWPKRRTVDECVHDFVNTQLDERNGGNHKVNASLYHHCMWNAPILPITTSTDHIVPPVLHIMLGLVQRFFQLLERLCQRVDRGHLGERDQTLNEEWEAASIEVQGRQCEVSDEEQVLKVEEEYLRCFKVSANSRNTQGEESISEPCSLPACALAHGNPYGELIDVKWIQCLNCGDGADGDSGWYHLGCLGLGTEYDDSMDDFKCPVCEGKVESATDVVQMQKKRVEKQKKRIKKAKEEYDEAKKDLSSVYERVCKDMGEVERELNRVLEKDLKVERQAYHSQCFVGNHCKKIMKEHEKLLHVLIGECDEDELENHRLLFSKLDGIFKYNVARFLDDHEVDDLVSRCNDFGSWFPTKFENETIPPKLHMLVCAMPICAMKWRTLGLLSEHGLESLHAVVNADENLYCRVGSKTEKLKLVFQHHGQRAMADKEMSKPVPRKCESVTCLKGRYRNIDGVRKCAVCGFIASK